MLLHTLNIRLSREQLGYIANHAHDEAVDNVSIARCICAAGRLQAVTNALRPVA
ncbi:hypothetical protein MDOR_25330 [Mycolicibacterium doricum]|uniref:Uncharacterized protein n=1 Tax=Mycolicibacterium doricum TaxID=126673 RepID=A0A7I7VST8_9MYCO|nr:hypothetical protein MDOR_25330 [Mycolicibacterium doricum]